MTSSWHGNLLKVHFFFISSMSFNSTSITVKFMQIELLCTTHRATCVHFLFVCKLLPAFLARYRFNLNMTWRHQQCDCFTKSNLKQHDVWIIWFIHKANDPKLLSKTLLTCNNVNDCRWSSGRMLFVLKFHAKTRIISQIATERKSILTISSNHFEKEYFYPTPFP